MTTDDSAVAHAIPGGTRRGHILDDDAIAALYARPRFTPEERAQYFTLSTAEERQLAKNRDDHTKLFFLLQLGYFHASQRFFTFTFTDVLLDAQYLCERYQLVDVDPATQPPLHADTIRRQRESMCRLTGYREATAADRARIQERAGELARISSNPLYVFQESILHLSDEQIIGPAYTGMQDLIRQALTAEHARLTALLHAHLTPDDRQRLTALLQHDGKRRPITWLKHDPKDFTQNVMRDELARGTLLHPLAQCAATVLPVLGISQAAIAHYAWLVGFYSLARLEVLDPDVRMLYLLCFVQRRYLRLNDHVITCFLHLIKEYQDAATTSMQEQASVIQAAITKDLPKVGNVLKLLATPQHPPETPLV